VTREFFPGIQGHTPNLMSARLTERKLTVCATAVQASSGKLFRRSPYTKIEFQRSVKGNSAWNVS
jgi:hypothetical protein